jgi:hypothetical protein
VHYLARGQVFVICPVEVQKKDGPTIAFSRRFARLRRNVQSAAHAPMNVQDFKQGCGFITEGISFVRLCDCLAKHPHVIFTDRRRFFWGAADIRGEFVFHGIHFKIEPWDIDDSLFVSPKDEGVDLTEIAELRDHVALFKR